MTETDDLDFSTVDDVEPEAGTPSTTPIAEARPKERGAPHGRPPGFRPGPEAKQPGRKKKATGREAEIASVLLGELRFCRLPELGGPPRAATVTHNAAIDLAERAVRLVFKSYGVESGLPLPALPATAVDRSGDLRVLAVAPEPKGGAL
jgi:hypothetical protein